MCTFDDIQNVNRQINVSEFISKKNGKVTLYTDTKQKIKAFRMLHPNGGIQTDIVRLDDNICVIKAIILDESGNILSTGTAYEDRNNKNSLVNASYYIENAETSAIGRALSFCGFGIDSLMDNEKSVVPDVVKEAELRTKIISYANRHLDGAKISKICDLYGISSLNEMDVEQCRHYIKTLEEKGGNINE